MSCKIKSNCLKFSSLFAFLLLLQPARAQYNFNEVDELLTKNQKLLGGDIIAMIYKDGKLVYNKQLNKEFTGKTQVPIASCSKWLTAALTMIFVEEGKISLDDPVAKYIPVFTSYSKKYVTIRNCLSHTTGIHAEEPGLKAILSNKKYATLEEEATGIAKREIERNPGEMFFYSNIGLNIVGRILEVVSKKTFDRLIADRLLRPLKMRQTTFYIDYDKSFNPSGGALSTANDYINFLSMILNKGMFEGKRILSEKSIAEMQKVQTGSAVIKYEPAIALGYGYGLGEWIRDKDASGAGTVITSPGIFGSYPLIDNCRGYACLIFAKTLLNEQKKEVYDSLKDAIDKQISSNCK
ncbi:MAG: serine hydrolase domain-containing protein [Chitinophagaceae bacterium]